MPDNPPVWHPRANHSHPPPISGIAGSAASPPPRSRPGRSNRTLSPHANHAASNVIAETTSVTRRPGVPESSVEPESDGWRPAGGGGVAVAGGGRQSGLCSGRCAPPPGKRWRAAPPRRPTRAKWRQAPARLSARRSDARQATSLAPARQPQPQPPNPRPLALLAARLLPRLLGRIACQVAEATTGQQQLPAKTSGSYTQAKVVAGIQQRRSP